MSGDNYLIQRSYPAAAEVADLRGSGRLLLEVLSRRTELNPNQIKRLATPQEPWHPAHAG